MHRIRPDAILPLMARSTKHEALSTKHEARSTKHEALSTKHEALSTGVWLLALIAVIFAINYGRQVAGDVYWHMRAGQWILQHRAFPFHDPFSFTANNTWILQEWAFQVIAWTIGKHSLNLLVLLAFGSVMAALLVSFGTSRGRAAIPAAFLATAIAAGIAADMVDARPQVVGLLAFAILIWAVEKNARAGKGLPLWLPALFLVWANFHSSFTAGLIVLFIEVAGSLYMALKKDLPFARPIRDLGLTIGCSLAALINPNGIRLYEFPLRTISHSGMTRSIAEWTSPDFRSMSGIFLAIFILALMWGFANRRKPIRAAEAARLAVFLLMSLLARRLGPFFALACAPMLAGVISQPLSDLLKSRKTAVVAYGLAAIMIVWGLVFRISDIGGRGPFEYVTTPEVFPVAAVQFIKEERPPGPMFNELNYGSFLIWTLWPEYKVFVDNRNDIFYGGAFDEYMAAAMAGGNSAWRHIFDRRGINLVVIRPNSLLADALTEAFDWKLIYRDPKAVIFTRNHPTLPH